MTQENPITPSTELVQQWVDTYFGGKISQSNFHVDLATRAAQWGSDQELEACCEWINSFQNKFVHAHDLRLVRRSKPPSLKKQAMRVLLESGYTLDGRMELESEDIDIIHRALEQLND
jgi:hypothetical protein